MVNFYLSVKLLTQSYISNYLNFCLSFFNWLVSFHCSLIASLLKRDSFDRHIATDAEFVLFNGDLAFEAFFAHDTLIFALEAADLCIFPDAAEAYGAIEVLTLLEEEATVGAL